MTEPLYSLHLPASSRVITSVPVPDTALSASPVGLAVLHAHCREAVQDMPTQPLLRSTTQEAFTPD